MILRTQLTGERELLRELEGRAAEFQEAAFDLLNDYGEQLVSLTRQLAPRGPTGFLSKSVRIEYIEDGSGWEAGWFADDFAAAGLDPYYWYVGLGTRDTEAQPSLPIAWADLEPRLALGLERLTERFAA